MEDVVKYIEENRKHIDIIVKLHNENERLKHVLKKIATEEPPSCDCHWLAREALQEIISISDQNHRKPKE